MTPKWIVVRDENCFLDQKNSSRSIQWMMMVMEMIIITYYDYYYDYYHYAYVFGMGASKRPCFFEVFGVGWGGGAITFMSLACKVMRRGCCADVTLIIRWCYVEEMLMLLLGWGGVGLGGVGGCNNVHVSCVQGDAMWMLRWCYVDHTLMLRWGDVDAKAAETKTSATQKKKRKAVFSKLMAFVPQQPLKSHRDSHFSIPFHDFWHTHKI